MRPEDKTRHRVAQSRDYRLEALSPSQDAGTSPKKWGLEKILSLTIREQRTKEKLSVLVWDQDGANVSLRVHDHEHACCCSGVQILLPIYVYSYKSKFISRISGLVTPWSSCRSEKKIFPESIYPQPSSPRNGTKPFWTQIYPPKVQNARRKRPPWVK